MRILQGLSVLFALLSLGTWSLLRSALPLISVASLSDSQVWPQFSITLFLGLILPIFTLFIFSVSAWLSQRTLSRASVTIKTTWFLRILPVVALLAFVAQQVFAPGDPYGPSHKLLPGVFLGFMLTLAALVLLPGVIFNWVTWQRFSRWVREATLWQDAGGGGRELHEVYRRVNQPLLIWAAFFLLLGLTFVPPLILEWPDPMNIQTPAQQLMVLQQQVLTLIVAAVCLCSAGTLWFLRRLGQDLTHRLNPQHSRISHHLSQPLKQ